MTRATTRRPTACCFSTAATCASAWPARQPASLLGHDAAELAELRLLEFAPDLTEVAFRRLVRRMAARGAGSSTFSTRLRCAGATCADARIHFIRRAPSTPLSASPSTSRPKAPAATGSRRRAAALGDRHRARRHRHHRPDGAVIDELQPRGRAHVRLRRGRGDRPQRPPADARALPQRSTTATSRATSPPASSTSSASAAPSPPAHGRPHLPDRARRRRGPRAATDHVFTGFIRDISDRVAAAGPRRHPAGGAQPRRPAVGDGRDRFDDRARTQPAADRDRQLRRGGAPPGRGRRHLGSRRRSTWRRPSPRPIAPAK